MINYLTINFLFAFLAAADSISQYISYKKFNLMEKFSRIVHNCEIVNNFNLGKLSEFTVLNKFLAQYKHTYRQLRVSHGSHMKGCT